jgi:hypothetical protein
MRRLLASRGASTAAAGALVLLLACGGYAIASGGGTISACVHNGNGTLYVKAKCGKKDSRITWNKVGTQGHTGTRGPAGPAGHAGSAGPAGPPGPAGPQGPAGPRGTAGTTGPTGPTGVVQTGAWAGPIAAIPVSSGFVFAGPVARVRPIGGQRITSSGSAVLGTTKASSTIDGAICVQPSGGGALIVLAGTLNYEEVTASTTRIPFAVSATGTPGAGTWKVGVCVRNESSTEALDSNDYSIGYALVAN